MQNVKFLKYSAITRENRPGGQEEEHLGHALRDRGEQDHVQVRSKYHQFR